MLPSLTAAAATRFRARRAERAERNRLRAEIASYRTPAGAGRPRGDARPPQRRTRSPTSGPASADRPSPTGLPATFV